MRLRMDLKSALVPHKAEIRAQLGALTEVEDRIKAEIHR